MPALFHWLEALIARGGPVMYPLLGLSVLSVALIVERAWFWVATRRAARSQRLRLLNEALRNDDRRAASRLISGNATAFDAVARALLKHGSSDAVAVEAVTYERARVERWMVTLSTIITAAPLLGILGTVTGIIQSFQLLGGESTLTDPRQVSAGIAQALITTAVGLVISLYTLFPYMIFRAQVDRLMSHLESLIASAQQAGQSRAQMTVDVPESAAAAR